MAITTEHISNRHFESHDQAYNAPMGAEEHITVLDKFKVSALTLSMVQSALEDVFPLLQPDTFYSSRDLVGIDLWDEMDSSFHREATICLQHLAEPHDSELTYSSCQGRTEYGFMIKRNH